MTEPVLPPPDAVLPGVARSLAVGLAAGSRSTLGAAAPLLVARRPWLRALGALAVAGEIVGDKLPTAPSRLDGPGPAVRAVAGAVGAVTLAVAARRAGDPDATAWSVPGTLVAAVVGAAGGLAGAYGGAAWRRAVAARDLPDWPAAVVEDVVALALAGTAGSLAARATA